MASIKVILRNKKNQADLYPVVLKIRKDGKSRIITLPYKCKKENWNFETNRFRRNYTGYNIINQALNNLESNAINVLNLVASHNSDFSILKLTDAIKKELFQKKTKPLTFFQFFDEVILEMKKTGRLGNRRAYLDTKNSFSNFLTITNRKCENFEDLDYTMLHKYEIHLRESKSGDSDGGIAVRMRQLRALYNKAINQGYAKQGEYPFGVYKIAKLKSKKRKIAIKQEAILKIQSLNLNEKIYLEDSRNFFLFSYYVGGINYADLAKLTWDNVIGNRLYYKRSKTKTNFNIKLNSSAMEIVNNYYEQRNDSNYIFPILFSDRHISENQIYNRRKKMIRKYNSQLKEIASLAGIKQNITSYTPRHSFANSLRSNGINIDIISQALGHADVKITEAYLNEFNTEKMDEVFDFISS